MQNQPLSLFAVFGSPNEARKGDTVAGASEKIMLGNNDADGSEELESTRVRVDKSGKVVKCRRKINFSQFQCKLCTRYFSNNSGVRRHLRQVHFDYKKMKCRVCHLGFDDSDVMEEHYCGLPVPNSRYSMNKIQAQYKYEMDADEDDSILEMPAPIVELIELDETIDVPKDQSNEKT